MALARKVEEGETAVHPPEVEGCAVMDDGERRVSRDNSSAGGADIIGMASGGPPGEVRKGLQL